MRIDSIENSIKRIFFANKDANNSKITIFAKPILQ